MDDSWQDAALTNRHLHNRTKGRNIGAGGKSKSLFDVRRIFGTYEVKCAAAEKKAKDAAAAAAAARLEVHGLNDTGNAVYAELVLPGVLHAVCIFAGSRKTLSRVIEGFKKGDEDEDDDEGEEEDDDEHDSDDELENQRAQEFEKNSFRSPKFWMKWQGRIICPSENKDKLQTDMGYLVFSGNSCDKFEGTLSCEALEWKNTKIKGWSIATKPQRDLTMEWQDT